MSSKQNRMVYVFVASLALVVVLGWMAWRRGAPRRASIARMERMEEALSSGDRDGLLDLVVLPAAVRGRSAPEQSEFLAKALADEISPEGLMVLKQHADFGPLKVLFPDEAESWAQRAGVDPDDCVAFRLERNGLRAEVVLVKPVISGQTYQIVRMNNVNQMAEITL